VIKDFFESIKMEDIIAVIKGLRGNPELANERDKLMRTPLHWAAKRNFEKLIIILLDFGANPKLKDHLGRTARDLAMKKNFREIADVRILPIL
jgi:ankyrin repeat protein